MKESNPITVLIFCVILLILGGWGIIDCIWTIIHHWNINIPTILENLTIGYMLRIIWWICGPVIWLAFISVLFDDKSDL